MLLLTGFTISSYSFVANQQKLALPAYPSGIDPARYFPQDIPEDRNIFIEMLRQDSKIKHTVRIKLVNHNPKVDWIVVEPWGAGQPFPLGEAYDVIMGWGWSEKYLGPDVLICKPGMSELPEESKALFISEIRPTGALFLYPSPEIGIFYEDGTVLMPTV